MRVARLNLSHSTHAYHEERVRSIRAAEKKTNQPIAILGDLQGPRLRVGELPAEGLMLEEGKEVRFVSSLHMGKESAIPLSYEKLSQEMKKRERIFIDDGLLELVVTKVGNGELMARVVHGGTLLSHKGMNVPDTKLGLSALTDKDKDDAVFLTKLGVDWLALSFVVDPKDVKLLRRISQTAAGKNTPPRILLKIERREAIDRFAELLEVADGIMVARGDLAIEIPAAEVPVRQKQIVDICRDAGKPVIVATQMLDSMIRQSRPTRAEVSDVANAVFDHTDAVMLSGETAAGKYPLLAVETMSTIIQVAEKSMYDDVEVKGGSTNGLKGNPVDVVKSLAENDEVDLILTTEETLFREHPEVPLYLVCPSLVVARQNMLRWGVRPLVVKPGEGDPIKEAIAQLKRLKVLDVSMEVATYAGGKLEVREI